MQSPRSAPRSPARRIRVALLSLLVALLACEGLLAFLELPAQRSFRFLGPLARSDVFETDRDRFWRLRPDTPHFTANAAGLRGWLPGPKRAGDLRLAVVGDSCTFGTGVRYEETYGLRLERLLQAALPDARVECVLAALPGYTSHQSRVLYATEVAPLEPDLTVLYVGGYNDYVAAIGPSDAERGALRREPWRRAVQSTRTGRVLMRSFDPELPPEEHAREMQEAFARGEAPGGRRVPLEDFRANLRGLIAGARGVGSRVVVVLPPVAQRTLSTHPVAHEYREAIRAIAQEEGVALCDAPAVFAAYDYEAPPDWPTISRGLWPCFVDGVHPSSFGHGLLAGAVFELLGDLVAEHAAAPASEEARPRPAELSPATVVAGVDHEVLLSGEGFARPGAVERIWIGPSWVRRFELEGDEEVRVTLPADLPPGEWTVTLIGSAGATRGPSLRVQPAPLEVRAERRGDRLHLEASGRGPAGWQVNAWLSEEPRDPPTQTRFGSFGLAAEPDGRPEGREGPFAFERLTLIPLGGVCGEDGRWSWQSDPDLALGDDPPPYLFVQGLCLSNYARAVLTERVEVRVPADDGG